ncbi:hypothetical protein [Veillonella agrestimuris]|uniref:hypothetical protein n=1 Tax=Veillonella agrestimuris TaxID=2941340 RepID=UPI00203B8FC8|nr:hypothetical protein [Veillonella agrestimuris]
MISQSWKIAFAYIGVIIGAGLSSGQDLLQYFLAFGSIGLIGVFLLGVLNACFGKIMLTLGSYYRADNHEEVFAQISHPIITRLLDIVLVAGSFIMGFVMVAGAGANLNQQFDLPFWIGGALCSLLIIIVSFMDFDKITNVLGIFTPIMIAMIALVAGYTFIFESPNWSALESAATTITPATSSVWLSVINYYALCAMTAVSMAFILGGSVVRIGIADKGGTRGGILIGVVILVAAAALYANLDKVKDADMPMLAIVNNIHPILSTLYAITVFSLIFNTAFSLYYSIARRYSNGSTQRMRLIMIIVVLIGYICSFFGFKALISLLYPILGYMGCLLLCILFYGYIRDRKDIIMESVFRKKMLHLSIKRFSPHKKLTKEDKELFHKLGDISTADTDSLKEDIHEVAKEIIENNESAEEIKDYIDEHLTVNEEVMHQNIEEVEAAVELQAIEDATNFETKANELEEQAQQFMKEAKELRAKAKELRDSISS